jgi:hypothetical protein
MMGSLLAKLTSNGRLLRASLTEKVFIHMSVQNVYRNVQN